MIIMFFTGTQLLRLVHWPESQKWKKEYFINEIRESVNPEYNRGAR
jgi:hypothetical protein